MVFRLDSIAVDVEFLPLMTPAFYDDDVVPAIEIPDPHSPQRDGGMHLTVPAEIRRLRIRSRFDELVFRRV